MAEAFHVRRFVTASDISLGSPRLNLAFSATIFNSLIGISLPSEAEVRAMKDQIDALKDDKARLESKILELEGSLNASKEVVKELSVKHVGDMNAKSEILANRDVEIAELKKQMEEMKENHLNEVEALKKEMNTEHEIHFAYRKNIRSQVSLFTFFPGLINDKLVHNL